MSTAHFAQILEGLGLSLLVSTYQSGRVMAVRARAGKLNTHFRAFPSPMGIAVGKSYLALGTQRQVWEFVNMPALAAKVDASGATDACFVPRTCHVTGDMRIHEMAYAGDELWVVNTRFSCLATLDRAHSFVPRWRPPFVSALAPEDRCHLNGLAMVGGRPRYVTAHAETDTPAGWRAEKVNGGCVVDVDTGEVVMRGLSMPHSPRWHANRLWLLESGRGTLAVLDPASRRFETVAELPGFTRGLAFAGAHAFIGLSQVRETVFEGIPLCERIKERSCGIWVVNLNTGRTAAFLRFEAGVEEVFDVQVLPGLRYPDLLEPTDDALAGAFTLAAEVLAQMKVTPSEAGEAVRAPAQQLEAGEPQ